MIAQMRSRPTLGPGRMDAAPRGTAAPAKKTSAAFWLKAAVAIAALVLSAALFAFSPVFSIACITVTGNDHYDASQILSECGVSLGENGFSALFAGGSPTRIAALRIANVEDAILEAFPYIKSARARFAPPRDVDIEVEERSKSVVVPYLGSGLLVDEEGFVVDVVKDVQSTELPVVSGLDFDQYRLGKRLDVHNTDGAEAMIAIVGALRQSDRDGEELSWEIQTIDVSDRKNVLIRLKSGLVVNLGSNEDIYYCISATKEIVFRGLARGAKGLVDFSRGPRPIYIPPEAGETSGSLHVDSWDGATQETGERS